MRTFAELVANYVTHDAAWWQQQLKIADEGATFINQKDGNCEKLHE